MNIGLFYFFLDVLKVAKTWYMTKKKLLVVWGVLFPAIYTKVDILLQKTLPEFPLQVG